jgi:ureidoglycolate lyase
LPRNNAGVLDMTQTISLQPEVLSKEAFEPFGDVLETQGISPESINFGNTQKFGRLTDITIADHAPAQINIYHSRAIKLPFRIALMECHPLASQAFYPLHQRPFPVVVAPAQSQPTPENIRVFLTNGQQGVNIARGVWHHYQLSLGQDSRYLVVDRAGAEDNYQEYHLQDTLILDL